MRWSEPCSKEAKGASLECRRNDGEAVFNMWYNNRYCKTVSEIRMSGCMMISINQASASTSLCCVTCHSVTVLFFRCMAFAQQKSKEKGHKVEPEQPPPPEAHSSVGKEPQKVQKVCTKKRFKRPQKTSKGLKFKKSQECKLETALTFYK